MRLLGLDPLDLGERDVEVGAVLLVAPRNLPQLLLPLFEEMLVQEGAKVAIMILDIMISFSCLIISFCMSN